MDVLVIHESTITAEGAAGRGCGGLSRDQLISWSGENVGEWDPPTPGSRQAIVNPLPGR